MLLSDLTRELEDDGGKYEARDPELFLNYYDYQNKDQPYDQYNISKTDLGPFSDSNTAKTLI